MMKNSDSISWTLDYPGLRVVAFVLDLVVVLCRLELRYLTVFVGIVHFDVFPEIVEDDESLGLCFLWQEKVAVAVRSCLPNSAQMRRPFVSVLLMQNDIMHSQDDDIEE